MVWTNCSAGGSKLLSIPLSDAAALKNPGYFAAYLKAPRPPTDRPATARWVLLPR